MRLSAVARPLRPVRERADVLASTLQVTLQDRGIELSGDNTVLNPVDDRSKDTLREWSVLGGWRAVSSSGNDVETVEVTERLDGVLEGGVWVEDAADLLPVDDRGEGWDGVVGLSVVVDDFSACLLDATEVGPDGLHRSSILLLTLDHPRTESLNVHALEGEALIGDFIQQVLDPLGTNAGNGRDFVTVGDIVVGSFGVGRCIGARLEANVKMAVLVVIGSVLSGEEDRDIFLVDSAIDSRAIAANCSSDGIRGDGLCARVGLSNDGGGIELKSAKIGASDDAVHFSIKSVASIDSLVLDFSEGTVVRSVTVQDGCLVDLRPVVANGNQLSSWHHCYQHLLWLLEGLTESWSANRGSIELVLVPLDLRPPITTSFTTSLVVRVQFCGVGGRVLNVVEVLGQTLSNDRHLVDGQVTEVVEHVVVDASIALEDDLFELAAPA